MRGWLAVPLLLLTGCVGAMFPCRRYTVVPTGSVDGTAFDGRYIERCGALRGLTGAWELYGNGIVNLDFGLVPFNDATDSNAVPIHLGVSLPAADMIKGQHVAFDGGHLLGVAQGVDPNGIPFARAGLSSGAVDVIAQKFRGGVCDVDTTNPPYGPVFRMAWDLEWTSGDGTSYSATGEDNIAFDMAFAAECGAN